MSEQVGQTWAHQVEAPRLHLLHRLLVAAAVAHTRALLVLLEALAVVVAVVVSTLAVQAQLVKAILEELGRAVRLLQDQEVAPAPLGRLQAARLAIRVALVLPIALRVRLSIMAVAAVVVAPRLLAMVVTAGVVQA
jgi:hypothetical protein